MNVQGNVQGTVQGRNEPATSLAAEHVEVLIVGAGISGVGAAYHLTDQCPGTTFVVLEAQDHFGGTWWTHRYPGIRSDSDLYTFGYRFKPLTGPPIATAAEILKYMGEVIAENDLAKHIRYHHRILSADWSSADNLWTIIAERTDTGERLRFTANSSGCARAITATPRATPRSGRRWPPSRPDRASAEMAGRPRLQEQEGDRDRLRRHRRDAGAQHRRRLRPCHHVATLADLFPRRPQRHRDRRRTAPAANRRKLDSRDRPPQDSLRAGRLHEKDLQRSRRREAGSDGRRHRLSRPGLRHQDPFHPALPAVQQRIAFIPDGDLFKGIAAGKASVVTTRSRASPKPASR